MNLHFTANIVSALFYMTRPSRREPKTRTLYDKTLRRCHWNRAALCALSHDELLDLWQQYRPIWLESADP